MGPLGDFGDSLRVAIAIGMTVFMTVLRFDQDRIMRSDYFRHRSAWAGPLSYYALVLVFMLGIVFILPNGRSALFLVGADAGITLPPMLLWVAVALLNGAALALLRFRAVLPLPMALLPSRTLGAAANAVAEELQFRAIILGLLTAGGMDAGLAIGLQAVLFAAAHRRLWRNRDWYFLAGSLLLGYACGLTTIGTGSVVPAMVGHFAVTMAIYAFGGGRLRQRLV